MFQNKLIWSLMFLIPNMAIAQTKENLFYSSGKIYVVVAVLSIIFIGLMLYLIRLDKKIKQLENNED